MVRELQYIDLFAGCGGISLGLYKSGLQGLFAVEHSPDAFSTLQYNLIQRNNHFDWPDWLPINHLNINDLLKTHRDNLIKLQGQVDLVVGGPPCQGFSLVGQRRESDERNKLIHSYLNFVELVQPSVILFENVQGFTVKFPGEKVKNKIAYSEIVIKRLHDLGYSDAHGEMIDMSEYGVPQRRKRFLVIATRENLSNAIFSQLEIGNKIFLQEKGLSAKNSVSDALSDIERIHGERNCPDTPRFMSGILSSPNTSLQKYLRVLNSKGHVPDSHRFVNHTPEIKEIFNCLLEKAPRNKRIWGEEKDIYGIKKRNVTVLDPDEPSLTITTIPDDFVHYSEPRVMTVRECARLQTFPDWFEFKGRYTTGGDRRTKQTPRYTQVGNAVPPLFSEQLGLAIKQVLSND